MKPLLLLAGCIAAFSSPSFAANTPRFSLTGGAPYFVIPEVSYAPENAADQRWFVNYKYGLDSGVSLGFEQAVSDNQRHAVGVFGGALGIKNGHRDVCKSERESGDTGDELGCEFGYIFVATFDNHTVNGLGVSYSYNRHGLNIPGFRMRFEAGYGRIEDADYDKYGWTGGIAFGYQF